MRSRVCGRACRIVDTASALFIAIKSVPAGRLEAGKGRLHRRGIVLRGVEKRVQLLVPLPIHVSGRLALVRAELMSAEGSTRHEMAS